MSEEADSAIVKAVASARTAPPERVAAKTAMARAKAHARAVSPEIVTTKIAAKTAAATMHVATNPKRKRLSVNPNARIAVHGRTGVIAPPSAPQVTHRLKLHHQRRWM
jgi:hypothetical protein